ncbi:MAG: hypothetical protein FJ109_04900 [Deltaproteobacteria bacterium]|nr:hypothetical protein [Deltaproteobacteria bacterium]
MGDLRPEPDGVVDRVGTDGPDGLDTPGSDGPGEDLTDVPGDEPDEDLPPVDGDLPGVETDGVEPDIGADETGQPPVEEGYLSTPELGVRILGPSSLGVAQSIGSSIQVAGFVVGKPDAIQWTSLTTGQSGFCAGVPFWLSGKVDLKQGDNFIQVKATQGDQTATDSIVVTHNPAFLFGTELRIRPGALYTNTPATLVFSMDMGLYTNFDPSTLKLCESTQQGECVSDVHTMLDDGQVSFSGDEVGDDGVFSWKKSYKASQAGKLCFRVHAVIKAGFQQYTAYSPVVCVDVVSPVSVQECEGTRALLLEADQLYWATLSTADAATARQEVVKLLEGKAEVAEVGTSYQGYGVWVRFANGLLGAFPFSPQGLRGGGEGDDAGIEAIEAPLPGPEILISSKRSVVFGPYHEEFGSQDESKFIFNVLDKSECPPYVLEGPWYDSQATLSRFRTMWENGMVAVATHGDSYFRELSPGAKDGYGWNHRQSQELLWTGEAVDCTQLGQEMKDCVAQSDCPSGSECVITQSSGKGTKVSGVCIDFKQVDLRTGRVVMGPSRYGILPSFVREHQGRGYPDSVVYLGACRSLWNGTLAMEFYAAGAKAVAGYSGYVTTAFAYQAGAKFYSALVEEMKHTGDCFPEKPVTDPDNPGSHLRLLGAVNLNATNSDLINPSWETGNLTGWQSSGDGRVVTRLGITVPVEGKFMSLISTGMGYTPQVGEIFQTFCIPEGKSEMSFYWKLYSEEFKEWCGSIYQDTFEATLEGEEGTVTFVSASIDSLCPPQQCQGCGSQFDGLLQADVIFDQGDVWMTQWRKAQGNVFALAGLGAVTLRYFVTDKGDSIYDTAVLLDTIKLK